MLQLFVIAARNLVQRLGRTLLLGGVTAVVTALLVLLLGLFAGAREGMVRSSLALSGGHVTLSGYFKPSPTRTSMVITHAPKVVEQVRKLAPEVEHVIFRGYGYITVVSDKHSLTSDVLGIDLKNEPMLPEVFKAKEGSLDDFAQPGTMVLFEDQAKKLKAKVGDRLTLLTTTYRGTNNTVDVRLVAIIKNVGLESTLNTYMHLETWRQLFQLKDDATTFIRLYLRDGELAGAVKERLIQWLPTSGYQILPPDDSEVDWMKIEGLNQQAWTGQRLDVTSWLDSWEVFRWVSTGINALSVLLVIILMALISVGTTNTMWIAIRERTREIGTLRAIGMSRFRVMVMFLAEGFLLGVASTAAGVVLGWIIGAILNRVEVPLPLGAQILLMANTLKFQLDANGAFTAAAIITGCLTFISLIPASRAARLVPFTAFSHV